LTKASGDGDLAAILTDTAATQALAAGASGFAVATALITAIDTLTKAGGDGDLAAAKTALLLVKATTDTVTGGAVTIVSPVSQAGTFLTFVCGDDYTVASGRSVDFEDPGDWPDLAGATLTLSVLRKETDEEELEVTGAVVEGSDPVKIRFEPTHTDTDALTIGLLSHRFTVVAELPDEAHTLRTLTYGSGSVLAGKAPGV
jgi:hypothetical protein